jgi:hypothetical protein
LEESFPFIPNKVYIKAFCKKIIKNIQNSTNLEENLILISTIKKHFLNDKNEIL